MLGALSFDEICAAARRLQASDVHLAADEHPRFRRDGRLCSLADMVVTQAEVNEIVSRFKPTDKENDYDFDCALSHARFGRIRMHVAHSHGQARIALRFLAESVPSAEELGTPHALLDLCNREPLPGGLVLVVGATGQGKTTVLAALLEYINTRCDVHIVTIEDPIEYCLSSRRAHITQREIGRDTASYEDGIFAALRMDPDVLCIAELRSQIAIAAALRAAQTGHLVLATVHASDTVAALERVIHAFDAQRVEMSVSLAASLRAIVGVRLLPRVGGGRVAAFELLIAVDSIRALVRERKIHQIRNSLVTGRSAGMQTFEYALQGLLHAGVITSETAQNASGYPDEIFAGRIAS
jgi:twitching motility protein PilT